VQRPVEGRRPARGCERPSRRTATCLWGTRTGSSTSRCSRPGLHSLQPLVTAMAVTTTGRTKAKAHLGTTAVTRTRLVVARLAKAMRVCGSHAAAPRCAPSPPMVCQDSASAPALALDRVLALRQTACNQLVRRARHQVCLVAQRHRRATAVGEQRSMRMACRRRALTTGRTFLPRCPTAEHSPQPLTRCV